MENGRERDGEREKRKREEEREKRGRQWKREEKRGEGHKLFSSQLSNGQNKPERLFTQAYPF